MFQGATNPNCNYIKTTCTFLFKTIENNTFIWISNIASQWMVTWSRKKEKYALDQNYYNWVNYIIEEHLFLQISQTEDKFIVIIGYVYQFRVTSRI
jgi:hypothetical protein